MNREPTRRDILSFASILVLGRGDWKRLRSHLQAPEATFANLVPADKHLTKEWIHGLTARGSRSWYSGNEVAFIGMPVGGICAGQVNLAGDGRLWLWDIFNAIHAGVVEQTVQYDGRSIGPTNGANYIHSPVPVKLFEQGFAVRYKSGAEWVSKKFEATDWQLVEFNGEYPVATIRYSDKGGEIGASLTAYSPFIPLNADDSGLPCTVLEYTVTNQTSEPMTCEVGGWLENVVGRKSTPTDQALFQFKELAEGARSIIFSREAKKPPRKTIVFEDFSSGTFKNWTVTGTAFGKTPTPVSAVPAYQGEVGAMGRFIATSHNAREFHSVAEADAQTARMLSKPFEVVRNYIVFLIAGGNHPARTCVNLLVNGQVVQTITGLNDNTFRAVSFDVSQLQGQTAQLEIVDEETGGWGNIAVDHITFSDVWPEQWVVDRRGDIGEMALTCLDPAADSTVLKAVDPADPFTEIPSGDNQVASIVSSATIRPGESHTFAFAISWRFPNFEVPLLGKVDRHYATRFASGSAIVAYLAEHYPRLAAATKQFHRAWYEESTLPYWLLERTMATTATLASQTVTRFANGRFYGWEGVGCCEGTCGHVYQYAQAIARFFPELERTVRKEVDFGVAFDDETGLIQFRGEYGNGYAVDAQAGYVLRAYREHTTSKDVNFLKGLWPKVKLATEFLILQDGNGDGLIENQQHNTLDVDLYGPSSWLSSLYLAALVAAKAMAIEVGDDAFRDTCEAILRVGPANFEERLFNGLYFVQIPDGKHPDALRYGDGCEIDQVMGQWWLGQIGKADERIISKEKTITALKAIFRNNYLPKVGPYRKEYDPGRWFAMPDEGGTVICTFPLNDRDAILGNNPTWASMYFNECMTGFEYEVAGHMVAEGLTEEGLTIAKTVHERYRPSLRNPFNEVECSDHYVRCMAMYGLYIAACGFAYHGPLGMMAFRPAWPMEPFGCLWTGAEGWGTFRAEAKNRRVDVFLTVDGGTISLNELTVEVGDKKLVGALAIHDVVIGASLKIQNGRAVIRFTETLQFKQGDELHLSIL